MYHWGLPNLVKDLKNHKIRAGQAMRYIFIYCLAFILKLTIFTILPLLYYIIFSLVKKYLEQRALPAQLIIEVYDSPDKIFTIMLLGIICIGAFSCLLTNKKYDHKQFLRRFISLAWVLNVRITLMSSFLFCVLIASLGSYLIPQLHQLQPHTSPALEQPLSFMVRTLQKLHIVKHINTRLDTLEKAQTLYKHISDVSLLTYIGTHLTTLIICIWYFYRLNKYIREVAQAKT